MDTTRSGLLRNATQIVRKAGSASLNFRDLGHSVGVKSSTVHYYFPTKADLLREIAGEYTAVFITLLDQRTRDSKAFKQQASLNVFRDKTWNTPALAGRRLFIRNAAEMACVELPRR